ncbi:hypothetical protein DFH08DRAFT_965770 [Mycena albidolilacea]|uniref:Uncharacterized protein n=1 Tax=Mycena albidolilacea TaxID=1033008 RepID=A0AAD6ZQB1_9AGAR|nr:hypothetical protein DFH08DRAFT_965770 [Mycena albidolilacea]
MGGAHFPGAAPGLPMGSFTQHLSLSPAVVLSAPSSLSFSSVPLPTRSPGYNHSGKLGLINFLNGVMGYTNAQHMVNYIHIIVELILQPEYKD